MITINFNRLNQLKKQQKLAPSPKIRIIASDSPRTPAADLPKEVIQPAETVKSPAETIRRPKAEVKRDLVDKTWTEFNEVAIERKKLSNQIYDLVESGASRSELAALYQKIESFRPDLEKAFDSARHAEQHGTLPEEKKPDKPPLDILLLKDQKRKLIDKRSKLPAKIKKGHTNPMKVIEWQLDLDKANAEYELIDGQLKKLEGKE